ncbi:conserved oligomeric Golgi complex subunit 5-like protein [Carex littledalei]|uniref:Conserved oligomeric Golgi complex subunit 5-like protein n=1 Tax=Carex littledalei TaxID=544730 RepID=A0A833RL62_9POAL|nr:conserved oligomeric Golgi complex subunit 5-like protein [Carex littledalei]
MSLQLWSWERLLCGEIGDWYRIPSSFLALVVLLWFARDGMRDMAELKLAVQNLFPVKQLGPPYWALLAFRPVIFLETS